MPPRAARPVVVRSVRRVWCRFGLRVRLGRGKETWRILRAEIESGKREEGARAARPALFQFRVAPGGVAPAGWLLVGTE